MPGPGPGSCLRRGGGGGGRAGRRLGSLTHAPRSSSLLALPEPPPPPPPPPHGEGRAAGRRRARPRAHAPPPAGEARAAPPLAGAPGRGGGAAARRHRARPRGGRKERRDVRGRPPAPRSPPPLSPSPARPGTFARYGRSAARGAGPRRAARRPPGGAGASRGGGAASLLGGVAGRAGEWGVPAPPGAQAWLRPRFAAGPRNTPTLGSPPSDGLAGASLLVGEGRRHLLPISPWGSCPWDSLGLVCKP